MGGPIPNLLIWDGSQWVQRQPIGSDGDVASIHPMKVSQNGVSWWPVAESGETAPSAPLSFTATATSKSQINLAWAAPSSPGDFAEYKLYRAGSLIYTGTALSYSNTGLAAGTTYAYNLYGATAGGKFGPGASASAKTQLGEVTKEVTLNPTSGGSYNGAGVRRWDIGGGAYYSGYYSSTHGRQQSAFHYAIPADVRNCIRINAIYFAIQNDHSYNNDGVTQYIAISHTTTAGASIPGSTGLFGAKVTAKDGWWGGSQWQNITNLRDPNFNDTVAGNFRSRNAWGIHLKAPSDSLAYYSYWRNSPAPQLRVNYTVAG
jgi:hypothetical protein